MALIEIPLHSYVYRFRRLTWPEELRLRSAPGADQCKVVMAAAMVNVSRLPVTQADALRILGNIPEALIWRIWLLCRANLPDDRYYSSGGLYEAPDTMTYRKHIDAQDHASAQTGDAAIAAMEQDAPVDEISQQMFHNAQRSGLLTPVRGSSVG